LLSAILRQNPKIHAGMTSPVGALFESLISQVSAGNELAPLVSDKAKRSLLRGLFDNYYEDLPEQNNLVFDTNRAWVTHVDDLVELFGDFKIIACVRDVAWIMDSLERQYRSNSFEHTRLFNNWEERSTIYSRCETLAHPGRMVGFPVRALREMCYSEHANRLLIIDYEHLVNHPADVLPLIYNFIGEPVFSHDFNNVQYQSEAFDAQLGVKDLHTVRPKVAFEARRTILPPDLFERFVNDNFWKELKGSAANVITMQPDKPTTSKHTNNKSAKRKK
jgi:sulfotransferase